MNETHSRGELRKKCENQDRREEQNRVGHQKNEQVYVLVTTSLYHTTAPTCKEKVHVCIPREVHTVGRAFRHAKEHYFRESEI